MVYEWNSWLLRHQSKLMPEEVLTSFTLYVTHIDNLRVIGVKK